MFYLTLALSPKVTFHVIFLVSFVNKVSYFLLACANFYLMLAFEKRRNLCFSLTNALFVERLPAKQDALSDQGLSHYRNSKMLLISHNTMSDPINQF